MITPIKISSLRNSYNSQINIQDKKNKVSFGRALTTPERSELKAATRTIMNILGIDKNVMVIHSPSLPSDVCHELNKNINRGVGTSASYRFRKVAKFARDLFGADAIQIGPESKLTRLNHSPYSNGSFVQGEHLISPLKLFHNGLIKKADLTQYATKRPFGNTEIETIDYDECFNSNVQIIDKAFATFKKLSKTPENMGSFESFKADPIIRPWLNKNAVFHCALVKEHKNANIFEWDDLDRKLNLYLEDKTLGKYNEAKQRLKFLQTKYHNDIEKFKFTQYLIHDQKTNSREFIAKERVALIGDIKVGNGMDDLWSFPKAFIADLDKKTCSMVGCKEGQDWGVFALNPKEAQAHKFLKLKAKQVLEYNDGTRIDAAFGYVQPYLTQKVYKSGTGFENIDSKQVMLGDSLLKSLKEVFEERKINPKYIIAENIGTEAQVGETRKILKDLKIPEITYYNPSIENVQRKGIPYEDLGHQAQSTIKELKQMPNDGHLAEFDKKWFASSNHDVETLIKATNGNSELQKEILANDFIGSHATPSREGWKRQFMFTDAFGISNRYNTPEQSNSSWKVRLPDNFEEFYYHNLAENNQGYNFPEILLDAADKKGVKNLVPQNTLDTLEKYRQILKEKGPYSTYEVEQQYIKGPQVLKTPKVPIGKNEILLASLSAFATIPFVKTIIDRANTSTKK